MGNPFLTLQQNKPKSILATTLLTASIGLSTVAFGQVGPAPQPEKPKNTSGKPSLSDIKEKLSTMFIPQSKEEEEPQLQEVEVKRGAGMPGQFDTVKVKKTQQQIEQEKAMEAAKATAAKKRARPKLLQQPPLTNPKVVDPAASEENPPVALPSLDNEANPLGIANARKRLHSSAKLLEEKKFTEAGDILVPLKEWLVKSTEAHIALYKALNNVPSARAQAELEKQVALDFARMRDISFLQMGQFYIGQNQKTDAIPLLIEVVKSQPRGDIGLKAYSLLQEIGFTQKLQLLE